MAQNALFLLFLCWFVGVVVSPAWTQPPTRILNGYVYCHDCQPHVTVFKAEPIKGAKVAVICENKYKELSFYEDGHTDVNGLFNIKLKRYGYPTKDHCIAKIISSPHATCNVTTSYHDGDVGALIVNTKGQGIMGIVDQTIGPFAFTYEYCRNA